MYKSELREYRFGYVSNCHTMIIFQNSGFRGIAMGTKELRDMTFFFKSRGISPTIKELCSKPVANLYLAQYITERPHL